ncbi:MAG: hypothetical protein ACE5FT_01050 [Candidatus Nanoarchaeia archaeon]
MDLSIQKAALKRVFSKPNYTILAAFIALVLFMLTSVMVNLPLLWTTKSNGIVYLTKLIGSLMVGSFNAFGTLNSITQGVISILIGVSVSMVVFKIQALSHLDPKSSSLSAGGILAALLSMGCASCGMGVLSLLGIAGGLAVLPFRGLEIWIAGMLMLVFAIYRTSYTIMGTCKAN